MKKTIIFILLFTAVFAFCRIPTYKGISIDWLVSQLEFDHHGNINYDPLEPTYGRWIPADMPWDYYYDEEPQSIKDNRINNRKEYREKLIAKQDPDYESIISSLVVKLDSLGIKHNYSKFIIKEQPESTWGKIPTDILIVDSISIFQVVLPEDIEPSPKLEVNE